MTPLNRQLWYSDNLPVLKGMASESVDLIYLDPPFNSNRAYNIIYPDDLGQVTAFEDTWSWTPQCDVYAAELQRTAAVGVLQALITALGKVQMCAYLLNMAVRLVEMQRILKPSGSLYLHCDPTASHYLKIVMDDIFGRDNFKNEIVWGYRTGGNSPRWFARKHDIIFAYAKSMPHCYFKAQQEKVRQQRRYGHRSIAEFEDATGWYRLASRRDVWDDINALVGKTDGKNKMHTERLGYPTQKPLALLRRIVHASSAAGDLVLDPFCGCGTSIAAAEELKRNWIGIDITYSSIAAIKERFKRQNLAIFDEIPIHNQPQTAADVDSLLLNQASPLYARKEFEKFCVALVGGLPNNTLGADGGIDGRIPLDSGEVAICAVKSGRVGVQDVRALAGLLNRKQVAGVLLTRRVPTREMYRFAQAAGVYQPQGLFDSRAFAKIQILTLEQLLKGELPDLPRLRAG